MRFPFSTSTILLLALGFGLTACSVSETSEPSEIPETAETPGFEIVLVKTGEVVLSDAHVADYNPSQHRLVLSPLGRQRLQDFARWGTHDGQRFPRLGTLTGQEFALRIEREEIYRGHFWSMLMSLARPGLKIYDTVGTPSGDLFIRFDRLGDEPLEDPRERREIVEYFRDRARPE